MNCIITYKGNKYTQEQFKEYISSNKNEFSHIIASNKNVIDSFKRKMKDIDYVFSQSPELASIGNKAQYLQYLSTIFQNSKVKDIVYHGVVKGREAFNNILEKGFDFKSKRNWDSPKSSFKEDDNTGMFFSDRATAQSYGLELTYKVNEKGEYEDFAYDNTIPALLNIKSLDTSSITSSGSAARFYRENKNKPLIGMYGLEGGSEGVHYNYVVFEPEQIHILASKQDIENFSNFVNNTKKPLQENPDIVKQKMLDTLSELDIVAMLQENNIVPITKEGKIQYRIDGKIKEIYNNIPSSIVLYSILNNDVSILDLFKVESKEKIKNPIDNKVEISKDILYSNKNLLETDLDILNERLKLLNYDNVSYKLSKNDNGTYDIKYFYKSETTPEQDVDLLVNRLKKVFPQLKIALINAEDMGQYLDRSKLTENTWNSIPSFVIGDTVYLVNGRYNTANTIEELLHPFVNALYLDNNELFNALYEEALNKYPELLLEIKGTYRNIYDPEDIKKEFLTQVLQREYQQPKYSILSKFINWLKGIISKLTDRPINVKDLKNLSLSQITMLMYDDNARIFMNSFENKTFFHIDDVLKSKIQAIQNRVGTNSIQDDIIETILKNQVVTFTEDNHTYQDKDGKLYTSVTTKIKGVLDESDPEIAKYEINRIWGTQLDYIAEQILLGKEIEQSKIKDLPKNVVDNFELSFRGFVASETMNGSIILPQIVLNSIEDEIAGKPDYLIITKDGKIKILDLKASKNSITAPKHETSKFDTLLKDESGNIIRLSTRGQHTVQVKSYAKMLENYGLEVTDIYTLHYKEKVKETFNNKKELVGQELEDIYLEGAIDHNKPDYIDERILAEQVIQTIKTEQAEDDTAKREQRKIESAQNILDKLNKLVEDWKIVLNTKVIKSQNFKNYVSELSQFVDILKEESNPEIVYGELIDFYSKRLFERNQSVEKMLSNDEEITVNKLNIFKHYAEETEFIKNLLQQTELLVSNPYINGLALNLNEYLEDFLDSYELFREKALKQTLEDTLQGTHDIDQLLNEAMPTSNDISIMSTYARRVVESGDLLLTTVDTLVKNKLQYVKDLMKQFQSEVSSFARNVMLNHSGEKGEEFHYMLTKNKKGEITGHIVDNLDWYKYKEIQDEYYKNCYNAEGKLRSLETVDKSLTKEEQQAIKDRNIELWRARKQKRLFDQEERVVNGLIEDGEFHKYSEEFKQARDKYFEPRINEKYDTVHWDVKEGVTKKELIAYYNTYYTTPVEYASMIMYKGQPTGEIEWKEQRFPKKEFIEKVTTQENGLLNPKYTEILSWKNSSNPEQKAKYDFYIFYTTKMKELIKLLPEKQGHKLNGQIARIKQRLMTEATVNMKGGWFKVFVEMIKSVFSLKAEASSVMVYSDNEIDQETLPILFVADFKSESLINYLKLKKDFIRLSYRNLPQDTIIAQLIDRGATQKQIQSFLDLKIDFKNYKNYKLELNKTEKALYLESSKITAKELETNLGENLTVFAQMVYGYDSMNSIESIIQLIKDKIKNKKYTIETSLGDKLRGKNTNEDAFVTGENSNVYKRLNSYLEMTYYKTARPFDSKIGQIAKKMLSLMSLRSVGLNPFGQFNNYLIGKIANFIETNPFGQTGLYWNRSHINEADLEYKKSLIDFSNSLDKGPFQLEHLKTNKYDAIVDFFNMERGYTPAGTYGQFSVKDRLLEKSFYMQQKIEYALQTKTGVSILMAKKLINSITGEESSVYNAMEFNKQKGVVQFKEGFSLTDKEKYALTNFIYEVNSSIHGNYAVEDKMAIQSTLLGELVTVYRKHIVPGFDQRFRKAYYNDIRGWQEGRYVTAQQFFNSLAELKDLKYAWDSLSDQQKINMQKNLTELGFVVATFIITGLLAAGADDDDSKLYNFFRVSIDKLNSEMLFYYPIVGTKQQAQFLKNPSAALSYAGDIADIFTAGYKTSIGDPYFKTGINKGELRLTKEFMDVLPVLQLVNKWQSFETVKSFYIK